MSVLISSSPPIPSLFLDLYQEHSIRTRNTSLITEDDATPSPPRMKNPVAFPDKPFRPKLSFVRRKKSVVFADSMGLPLTQVKMLKVEELETTTPSSPSRLGARAALPPLSPSVTLSPGLRLNFVQPISRLNYLDKVRQNHVGLENVLVNDFTLTGTILVHNICFQKSVKVRYTQDYWLTYHDVTAEYSSSVAGDIDKFTFTLSLPPSLPPGARVEFCVSASLGGDEFWDSNSNQNYQVECVLMPPKTSTLSHNLYNAGLALRPRASPGVDGPTDIYY